MRFDPSRPQRTMAELGAGLRLCRGSDLVITETAHEMIVHHAYRLHVSVTDRRSHEREPSAFQVRTHRVGLLRLRRNLTHAPPMVFLRAIADELPHVGVERSKFLLNFEESMCVPERCGNLDAVANDSAVGQEPLQVPPLVTGNLSRVEAFERGTIMFTLPQDSHPREPGLRALEDQELEQPSIVVLRDSPFSVMVLHHERIGRGPPASHLSVR